MNETFSGGIMVRNVCKEVKYYSHKDNDKIAIKIL